MPLPVLKKIDYQERPGKPLQWTLHDFTLGRINLVVGKNATGKSRALALIKNLAEQLRRDELFVDECGYEVVFEWQQSDLRYILRATGKKVYEEKLWCNGELVLDRDDKKLRLKYEEEGKFIDHEPSDGEVSAVSRRDRLQHEFLLPLRDWADAVRYFAFGTELGKRRYGHFVNSEASDKTFNDRNCEHAVLIFRQGMSEYKKAYRESLLEDMNQLGYPLTDIALDTANLSIEAMVNEVQLPMPGELKALAVREEGVHGMYRQDTISQGMFRALSLLAQVTYSQMSNRANCIIIDDIGEGLDFERSSILIEMLRKKANESNFQLIMATNDQFVMNKVPLNEWSVLQRKGGEVMVRNIHNSKKQFEDFNFVGLSNFAFFEMDFADPDSRVNRQLNLEAKVSDE
jgi:hypothetical protein